MSRYKTYFGVPIPYFREENMGDGGFTIRFVVKGRVVSKKNHQQAVARTKEAKEFLQNRLKDAGQISISDALAAVRMVKAKMIGNLEYNGFLKQFKPVIQEQMKAQAGKMAEKGLKFPLSKARMTIRFYFADRYITDTVNKQQSIQDLLVDSGAIKNDDYATVNPISAASANYFGELRENICLITLYCEVEKTKNTS